MIKNFFQNKNINLLNIHIALIRFSESFILFFSTVFLFQQGISFPVICLIFALDSFLCIITRCIHIPVVKRIGIKPSIIIGICGIGLSYIVLSFAHGLNIYVRLYIIIGSLFSPLYRQLFHYLFACNGQNDDRGKNISIQIILVELIQALSPLLGAIMILYKGFLSYSLLIFFTLFISVLLLLPISYFPSIKNISPFKTVLRKDNKYCMKISFLASSAEKFNIFPRGIIIFLTLGSVGSLGKVMSAGICISLLLQIFLGKALDDGKAKHLNILGMALYIITLLGKVFFGFSWGSVSVREGISRVSYNINGSVYSVGYYNSAKNSNDTYRDVFFGETGWDLGCLVTLLIIGSITSLGFNLRYVMLLGIFPIFFLWYMMHVYYKKNSSNKKQSKIF